LHCAYVTLAARLNIEYPMLFELTGSQSRVTHCGVLEFVADEGLCYLPHWVRASSRSLSFSISSLLLPADAHTAFYVGMGCAQMMQQLLLTEGQLINVKSATLPKGTYTKLQPVDEAFLDLTNPKAVCVFCT
jgi:ubiquitin fusion degradation protein 1